MTTHAAERRMRAQWTVIFDDCGVLAEIDDRGDLWISTGNDADEKDIEIAILDSNQRLALARALVGPEEVLVRREDAHYLAAVARDLCDGLKPIASNELADAYRRVFDAVLTPEAVP